MRSLALNIVGLLSILLCQGCVSSVTSHAVADQRIRDQKTYTLLGPVRVPNGNGPLGCGSQAFGAAAAYVDRRFDADQICKELPWGTTGVTAPEILIAARQRGLSATLRKGDWKALVENVSSDHPTLVLFDSRKSINVLFFGNIRGGHEMYHWALVSGFSAANHSVLLAAPEFQHYELNQQDFESRWNETDCCLIEISSGKEGSL